MFSLLSYNYKFSECVCVCMKVGTNKSAIPCVRLFDHSSSSSSSIYKEPKPEPYLLLLLLLYPLASILLTRLLHGLHKECLNLFI
ncbi:hypothetical protein P8452_36550 [Trifolium repens]|nr:hypothetical protein P8452_36550 [Trifolium repens]